MQSQQTIFKRVGAEISRIANCIKGPKRLKVEAVKRHASANGYGAAKDIYFSGGGTANTFELIKAIIHLYRPSQILRALALGIIRDVPEKDAWAETQALFEWCRQWKYVKDPHNVELVHTPPRILNNIARFGTISDCDDFTVLLVSLLLQIGHRPQLRMVGPFPKGFRLKGKLHDDFSHIYLADLLPLPNGKQIWVPLDPINKTQPMGWETPNKARMETFTF